MATTKLGAIQNAHLGVGSQQRERLADFAWRNGVVVAVEADVDGLGRAHLFPAIERKRMRGQCQQARLLLLKRLLDGEGVILRPRPAMSDLVAPEPGLAVAFGQNGEGAARPEGFANVADGAFHASFLIARAHLAGPGLKVIVAAEVEDARVEMDQFAAPFLHHGAEIVVEDRARGSAEGLEGMHMAAQEVLHGLIKEELQIEGARVGQREDKATELAPGAAHGDFAEVRPIGWRLLAGQGLQLQERIAGFEGRGGA